MRVSMQPVQRMYCACIAFVAAATLTGCTKDDTKTKDEGSASGRPTASANGTTVGAPSAVVAGPSSGSGSGVNPAPSGTAGARSAGQDVTYTGDVTTALAPITPSANGGSFVGNNKAPEGQGVTKVKLVTYADGRVEGLTSGALGDLRIGGRADGDNVSATLTPVSPKPQAFGGTLIGTTSGKAFTGALYASSADGSMVRKGDVTLAAP